MRVLKSCFGDVHRHVYEGTDDVSAGHRDQKFLRQVTVLGGFFSLLVYV